MPSFAAASFGRIFSSSGSSYSTARAGSGLVASTTTLAAGQDIVTGTYKVWEGFLSFDTSSIADSEIIKSAVLALDIQTDNSVTEFILQARSSTWTPGGLTTADWVAGASLSPLTLLATFDTSTLVGSVVTFTETANFAAAINKTGNTEILLCSDRTVAGTTPTTGESFDFDPFGVMTLDVSFADVNPLRTVTSPMRW